ncbi:hypothetical protein [Streptomyces albogriseolus]|uniref:hypothetical protein n=1 Tax=Streptomyces albogriseolus TaxID=1887 RepID=UPI00345FD23D
MRSALSIADSIVKDIERATERVEKARAELVDVLTKGGRLDSNLSDRLVHAEATLNLWKHVLQERALGTGDDEAASRAAIAKGRARAMEIVMSGPLHSTSLTRRAYSEIEVQAARTFHSDLTGYED